MARLHLFFPENDLALARNLEHYTAPPAAVALRHAGALLGLWYGDPGDKVADYGTNASWYDRVVTRFGLETDLFDGDTSALEAAPWGWSKASRLALLNLGFQRSSLPDDEELNRIRMLSHRRTAIALSTALAGEVPFTIAPAAHECRSFDEVKCKLEQLGASILKSPWSSSGRGLIPVNRTDIDGHRRAVEGIISRQGSVLIEPRLDKAADFAMLFTMTGGRAIYNGLSLFATAGLGIYTGNELAADEELGRRISSFLPSGQLEAIRSVLPHVLDDIIGSGYEGPLGVDMMAVRNADFSLAPAVELNLRMTMGHVCRLFYLKHIEAGREGRFNILPTPSTGLDTAIISDTKIVGGAVDMAPPTSDFSFLINIEK